MPLADWKGEGMPPFLPYNFNEMQGKSIREDRKAYKRSDDDFALRHPGIKNAEAGLERETEASFTGLSPMVQNELMRSGLADALGSFGDTTAVGVGSGQAAAVGRSLGNGVNSQIDRGSNMLNLAEGLFPHRTFGMSGRDYSLMQMLNTKGVNDWAQTDWANDQQRDMFNYQADAANQSAAAQESNARSAGKAQQTGAMAAGGAAALGLLALALCWVARAVYGEENPRWRLFRKWMVESAPLWLFRFYLRNGAKMAPFARRIRFLLRPILDLAIA